MLLRLTRKRKRDYQDPPVIYVVVVRGFIIKRPLESHDIL